MASNNKVRKQPGSSSLFGAIYSLNRGTLGAGLQHRHHGFLSLLRSKLSLDFFLPYAHPVIIFKFLYAVFRSLLFQSSPLLVRLLTPWYISPDTLLRSHATLELHQKGRRMMAYHHSRMDKGVCLRSPRALAGVMRQRKAIPPSSLRCRPSLLRPLLIFSKVQSAL